AGLYGLAGGEAGLDVVVGAVEVDRRRHPAGVGEQLLDRHGLLAGRGERRDVGGGRVVEGDRAVLDELHDRHRGEELGQRREVEDGVGPHLDLLRRGQLRLGVCPPDGSVDGGSLYAYSPPVLSAYTAQAYYRCLCPPPTRHTT